MSSSMSIEILLQELPSARMTLEIIFISLFSLLTAFSFVNSLLTLFTCSIRKIRITVCGLYIIVYSIISLLSVVFLEVITVVVLFYNNELKEHPIIFCTFPSAFLNFTYAICLWLTAFIALERVLIQYSYNSLYRTRKHSVIYLVILFLFLGSGSAMSATGRVVRESPVLSTAYVCSFRQFPNARFKTAHKVIGSIYTQFVIPSVLSFLSVVLTLIHLIRHKITLTDLKRNSWFPLIMQQISNHKDFFVPPIVNIICALPEEVMVNIVEKYCRDKNMQRHYLRLHIAFDFVLYMILALTFFIYIYPSKIYMSLFRETKTVKRIKLRILYHCRPIVSNTVQAVSKQQVVEEGRLEMRAMPVIGRGHKSIF